MSERTNERTHARARGRTDGGVRAARGWGGWPSLASPLCERAWPAGVAARPVQGERGRRRRGRAAAADGKQAAAEQPALQRDGGGPARALRRRGHAQVGAHPLRPLGPLQGHRRGGVPAQAARAGGDGAVQQRQPGRAQAEHRARQRHDRPGGRCDHARPRPRRSAHRAAHRDADCHHPRPRRARARSRARPRPWARPRREQVGGGARCGAFGVHGDQLAACAPRHAGGRDGRARACWARKAHEGTR
mmetsp:Transcript_6395/g.23693  ORF Transcript_6395/g.23693 Transcript_6395/m.23693 type:complete len:247 (+) Transcript_6395:707-1447(+)